MLLIVLLASMALLGYAAEKKVVALDHWKHAPYRHHKKVKVMAKPNAQANMRGAQLPQSDKITDEEDSAEGESTATQAVHAQSDTITGTHFRYPRNGYLFYVGHGSDATCSASSIEFYGYTRLNRCVPLGDSGGMSVAMQSTANDDDSLSNTVSAMAISYSDSSCLTPTDVDISYLGQIDGCSSNEELGESFQAMHAGEAQLPSWNGVAVYTYRSSRSCNRKSHKELMGLSVYKSDRCLVTDDADIGSFMRVRCHRGKAQYRYYRDNACSSSVDSNGWQNFVEGHECN